MKSNSFYVIMLMLLVSFVAGQEILTNADENGAITMMPDQPLVLQCNVTTDMPGTGGILWKHNGRSVPEKDDTHIKINKEDYSLHIDKAKEERDVGYYECAVDFGAKRINATIFVQTEVRVEPFHKSLNLVQGDRLVLTCKVKGYPPPNITWYKESVTVMNNTGRIKFETENNIKAAKLVIEELEYEDKAHYTCEAQGPINTVNTTILVRVKDKLAALWPFLGICAEVAILCTIIFVYEKKRVKPDFDESDIDNNPDNKNVQDQKEGGQDVRQRK